MPHRPDENQLANKALLMVGTRAGRAQSASRRSTRAMAINPRAPAAWICAAGFEKVSLRGDPDIGAMEAFAAGLRTAQDVYAVRQTRAAIAGVRVGTKA